MVYHYIERIIPREVEHRLDRGLGSDEIGGGGQIVDGLYCIMIHYIQELYQGKLNTD